MTIKNAFDDYILDHKCRGSSPHTITYYRQTIDGFIAFVGNIECGKITLRLCREYVLALTEDEGKNSVTVQDHVRALRAFLNWLYNNGCVKECIPVQLRLPKARATVKDVLTPAEIEKLFAALPDSFEGKRNAAMLSLMLGSGLRREEVITLRTSCLHLAEGYALVTGKGNKQRYVPIGALAAERLQAYLQIRPQSDLPQVFLKADGSAVTVDTLKNMFRKLKKITGIERLHAHLLRHTFATCYLVNSGDMLTLKTILGHTSLQMVEHYVHFAPAYVLRNFDEYSPLDNPIGKKRTP